MATTTPTEFVGIPSLSEEKVETIKEWYRTMLGDSDKAGDVVDEQYYTGNHEALEAVLRLLYDMPGFDETPAVEIIFEGATKVAVLEHGVKVWDISSGLPAPEVRSPWTDCSPSGC